MKFKNLFKPTRISIPTNKDIIYCRIKTPEFYGSQYIFSYKKQDGYFHKTYLKFYGCEYDVQFSNFDDFCFSVIKIYE